VSCRHARHSATRKFPRPVGVEQRLGFADAAAHLHRFETRSGGLLLPDALALGDEIVDPPPLQELGLGANGVGFGQLVDRDVDGDVLAPGCTR
jgi:hypothetical protein